MGIGSKIKKAIKKYKRELIGIATMGASEAGRQLSGYNQMRDMEKLTDEQIRVQEKQLELARQQAYTEAGNQMNADQAGTEEALAKALKKKSALQRTVRTSGQQRLGD